MPGQVVYHLLWFLSWSMCKCLTSSCVVSNCDIQMSTPHHITPHHTIPHHTTPHHTTPHHTTPHHTTPHFAVRVSEGLAGPRQSTQRAHQGPFGAWRHDRMGVAGASAAPGGRATGHLQGGPELRSPLARRLKPPASGAQHTTHSVHSDTQPRPVLKFSRVQDIPASASW